MNLGPPVYGTDVDFIEINRDFVIKWTKNIKKNEVSTTTITIALRSLRTIINYGFFKKRRCKDTFIEKQRETSQSYHWQFKLYKHLTLQDGYSSISLIRLILEFIDNHYKEQKGEK